MASAVLLSLAAAAAAAAAAATTPPSSSSSFSFLAMGDWGGSPDASRNYTTPAQVATAKGMAKQVAAQNVSLLLALGDNFYEAGLPESAEARKTRWEDTYLGVYGEGALAHVPWYVVAGNHDYKTAGSVDAEVAYSNRDPTDRWHFPSPFYTFQKSFPGGPDGAIVTVEFVMIDTVLLTGPWDNHEPQPLGHLVDRKLAADQWTFIEEALKRSTADWLFVAGHYPVLSVGGHGSTAELVLWLEPMLKEHGVAAYLNGHEHDMQHIRHELDYITTGAAHGVDYSMKHAWEVPKHEVKFYFPPKHGAPSDAGGFTTINLHSNTTMTVTYWDQDGVKPLYSYTANNRRHGAKP